MISFILTIILERERERRHNCVGSRDRGGGTQKDNGNIKRQCDMNTSILYKDNTFICSQNFVNIIIIA